MEDETQLIYTYIYIMNCLEARTYSYTNPRGIQRRIHRITKEETKMDRTSFVPTYPSSYTYSVRVGEIKYLHIRRSSRE